jgi:serine/threonine protein kinase
MNMAPSLQALLSVTKRLTLEKPTVDRLPVPTDSPELREALAACLPSLVLDGVAAPSGQRVVYFGHFDDALIPADVVRDENTESPTFLHGWEAWGQVVIKVVAGGTVEGLQRLQAETEILSTLRPSNFPTLHYANLFTDDPVHDVRLPERLYVTIEEFVAAATLSDIIDTYRGDERRVVELAGRIGDALLPLWSHPRRYVHRDIKPANILVRADGTVVVIDLGIVRETGAVGVTVEGWGMGPLTLDYAAPEQIANDKDAICFKTDFFAIGVLIYRLSSGSHPFARAGQLAVDLAYSVQHEAHPSLAVNYGISQPLSDFVDSLLQKEPWKRPRTPQIFLQNLNQVLGG